MFRAAEDSSDIINFDNRFDEKKKVTSLYHLEWQVICRFLCRHKSSPNSLWMSHVMPQSSVVRSHEQNSSCSVSLGVGTSPWPSNDVDPGIIIQLFHYPLLFDGQDGVAKHADHKRPDSQAGHQVSAADPRGIFLPVV